MSEEKKELSAKEFLAFSEGLSEYLTQEALKRVYAMLKISDNLVGNLIEGQVKRGVKPNEKLVELHKLNGEALAFAEPMYETAKEGKTLSAREVVKEGKTLSEGGVK